MRVLYRDSEPFSNILIKNALTIDPSGIGFFLVLFGRESLDS